MKQALGHLVNDLLAAIVFLALYLAGVPLAWAAAIAVVAGIARIAVELVRGRPVFAMQWMSLGVIIVLSTASILTQSPRFVMMKPSLGHFAIAAVMLKRGWMTRYLPEIALRYLPERVPVIAGYAWAGLLAAIGLANIAVAGYASFHAWAWFITVGATGAKVAAFAVQYVAFRILITRAIRRERMPAAAALLSREGAAI